MLQPHDNDLAVYFRSIVKASGLTYAEIARRTGVHDTSVSQIMRSFGGGHTKTWGTVLGSLGVTFEHHIDVTAWPETAVVRAPKRPKFHGKHHITQDDMSTITELMMGHQRFHEMLETTCHRDCSREAMRHAINNVLESK